MVRIKEPLANLGGPSFRLDVLPADDGLGVLYGHDGRSATLILYIEPQTADGQRSQPTHVGYHGFGLALGSTGAFAAFLPGGSRRPLRAGELQESSALIEHGPVPDNLNLGVTFLALRELRMRTITLLNQADDWGSSARNLAPRQTLGT